ncbi:MAG: DUF4286 family protein [Bacteroidota bacterium]
MILYNVTIKVDQAVHEDWLQWMQQVHIPEMMQTQLFEEYKLCRILHEEPDGMTYAIQYFCKDMKTLHQYQVHHAQRLQAAHQERYRDQYVAIRTLMEVLN